MSAGRQRWPEPAWLPRVVRGNKSGTSIYLLAHSSAGLQPDVAARYPSQPRPIREVLNSLKQPRRVVAPPKQPRFLAIVCACFLVSLAVSSFPTLLQPSSAPRHGVVGGCVSRALVTASAFARLTQSNCSADLVSDWKPPHQPPWCQKGLYLSTLAAESHLWEQVIFPLVFQ